MYFMRGNFYQFFPYEIINIMLQIDEKEGKEFKDLYEWCADNLEINYTTHASIHFYSIYDNYLIIDLPKVLINIIKEYVNEKYKLNCEMTKNFNPDNRLPVTRTLYNEMNDKISEFVIVLYRQVLYVLTSNIKYLESTNLKFMRTIKKENRHSLYHSYTDTIFKYMLATDIEIDIFSLFFDYFIKMLIEKN